MCLLINKNAKELIAEEDIIVYKALVKSYSECVKNVAKTGDKFTAIINNRKYEGTVSTEYDTAHLCTNDKYLFLDNVYMTSLIINEEELIDERNCQYLTFYRDFPIKIGETYTSELVRIDYNTCSKIKEGLHSFKLKGFSHTMAKCIIPKGSKYYKGTFLNVEGYASDTLKYLEIIN